MSNIIPLDLWGGNLSFDIDRSTFILNRQYGLFSNITVGMFGVCKIKSLGYNVQNIDFYLAEYDNNYNFYNDLFIKKDISSNNELLTLSEAEFFMNTVHPTSHGLSRGWNIFYKEDLEKVMSILQKLYYHYFESNNAIMGIKDFIKNINYMQSHNTAFIWARKTDKFNETQLPSADRYLSEINNYSNIQNIYLQTDDPTVVSDFQQINDNRIKYLNSIPMSSNSSGFHERLYMISNEEFMNKYQISKIQYLQQILAMVSLAAESEYFVGYPGNLTTIIPMIKGSFNNCLLFKDDRNLIE